MSYENIRIPSDRCHYPHGFQRTNRRRVSEVFSEANQSTGAIKVIRSILFLGWSIALVSGGAIVGWQSHQKLAELQQNPWAIVQIIGGK